MPPKPPKLPPTTGDGAVSISNPRRRRARIRHAFTLLRLQVALPVIGCTVLMGESDEGDPGSGGLRTSSLRVLRGAHRSTRANDLNGVRVPSTAQPPRPPL
jgi:hypothetical protein